MSNFSTRKVIVAMLISVGAALGTGFGYGFTKTVSVTKEQKQSPKIPFQVSSADYERLKLGMTLTDAQALLSQGTEIRRTVQIAVFEWKNADGSKIIATFENGKLTSKEQFELK